MNFTGLLAVAAASAPSLLAYNVSPSPTFLNQALACGLWGAFVVASAGSAGGPSQRSGGGRSGPGPLQAALLVMLLAVGGSWGAGGLPASLALSAVAMLAAAMLLAAGGAAQRGAAAVFVLFCAGWVVAGVFNVAIAMVQVFTPNWPDGTWVASSGIVGRAVGNLRQPNHLSSLLLWSAIAVVALLEQRRLHWRWALPLLAAMLFAVVLTASRTGLVSVGLLALWGLFDRRLSWPGRALLVGAPLLYALGWFGMSAWGQASAHTFGGAARLAETDVSGSRFGIWANTLELIRQNPWLGVGFGEFNFAWTLTPFPGRPTALFDHAHNLPLHLAAEIGLPLAGVVMALLLWALWRAAAAAWSTGGTDGAARRAALMMVLMIGLHSLLEYPLWYAYFLLPAAWAWGFALGGGGAERKARLASRSSPALVVGGALLVVGSVASVADYRRVAAIFSAPDGAPPLAQRIAAGQRSVLFAHHADYAAATTEGALPGTDPLAPFERSTHYLLDTRLMMAWSRALAAAGRTDEARAVAQRLREFRNPQTEEFFEVCEPASASKPASPTTPAAPAKPAAASQAAFQCETPTRAPGWREFLGR